MAAREHNLSALRKREYPRTLVQICLMVVVQNFRYYFQAAESSHGITFNRQMEFLQRRYSEQLWTRLNETGQLQTEYVKLLINRFTETLNLEAVEYKIIFEVIVRLKTIGENKIVSLKGDIVRETIYFYKLLLEHLPNLETVEFTGFHFNWYRCPMHTNGCPALEILEDIGKNCPLMKNVKIASGALLSFIRDSRHVSILLQNCPLLENISSFPVAHLLHRNHLVEFENKSLERVQKYALTHLCFSFASPGALMMCSVLCPRVSSITMVGISEKNIDVIGLCSEFTALKHVAFAFDVGYMFDPSHHNKVMMLSSIGNFMQMKGRQLQTFSLMRGFLEAETLVKHCQNLKSLALRSVTMQPLSGKGKGLQRGFSWGLSSLKTLKFERMDWKERENSDCLKFLLSVADSLEVLSLRDCFELDKDFVSELFGPSSLNISEIDLRGTPVAVSEVERLMLCSSNLHLLRMNQVSRASERECHYLEIFRDQHCPRVEIVWYQTNLDQTEHIFTECTHFEMLSSHGYF